MMNDLQLNTKRCSAFLQNERKRARQKMESSFTGVEGPTSRAPRLLWSDVSLRSKDFLRGWKGTRPFSSSPHLATTLAITHLLITKECLRRLRVVRNPFHLPLLRSSQIQTQHYQYCPKRTFAHHLQVMGVTASRTLSVAGPTDLNDITFRIVDQSRYPEVLELLYANFHPDEPMSRALNIYSGDHRVPAIDEYTLNGLKENLSLMAVDSFTNKLLGVSINGLVHKSSLDIPLVDKLKNIRNDKFRHIITVLHEVNQRGAHIFQELGTDVVFDIKMVTTDKLNRKSGLATDLIRKSINLARDLGYTAAKTEATGIYSRKASERLGFTMTAEFFYDEYIAADGTTGIFSDMGNHKCATLLVKRLLVNQDSIEENEPVRNESDHA
ncbi:uncharacterized protein LOC131879858 [Tigriopus californicus]|uniref:uncharacterized protein LOC131879858 n=1 Tax=Tigriopus californicus TaxID=6832 RepID=UPI0027DA5F04|nr:uncharacterized protein LOC131879858 [Tigriopus californicus]